jgi:hypothetical protein
MNLLFGKMLLTKLHSEEERAFVREAFTPPTEEGGWVTGGGGWLARKSLKIKVSNHAFWLYFLKAKLSIRNCKLNDILNGIKNFSSPAGQAL